MKRRILAGVGVVLCFLLTACVVDSDNPLSSPGAAQVDQRLVGDWVAKNNDSIRFSAKDDHWMRVVSTPRASDSSDHCSLFLSNRTPTIYDFYCTTIGDQTFLNVKIVDQDAEGKQSVSYVFYRYKIETDQTLHMWIMSQDETAAAVRSGKLKGNVHQDKHPMMVGTPPHADVDVHLTDSSANIVKFISRRDATDLFEDETDPLMRVQTKGD